MTEGGHRIRRGCPGGDRTPLVAGPLAPCAFLDRDGVLNRDYGYVHRVEDFTWIEGARDAIDLLKARGFWVVVATNQSGIERDFYTEADLIALSQWLMDQAPIDLLLYCPHLTGDCPARKPLPGMLLAAAEILPIKLQGSFFIGDKTGDMEAAAAFGIPGHMFRAEWGPLDSFIIERGLLDQR